MTSCWCCHGSPDSWKRTWLKSEAAKVRLGASYAPGCHRTTCIDQLSAGFGGSTSCSTPRLLCCPAPPALRTGPYGRAGRCCAWQWTQESTVLANCVLPCMYLLCFWRWDLLNVWEVFELRRYVRDLLLLCPKDKYKVCVESGHRGVYAERTCGDRLQLVWEPCQAVSRVTPVEQALALLWVACSVRITPKGTNCSLSDCRNFFRG